MSTSKTSPEPRAIGVKVAESEHSVDLADGRRIIVPLLWFPRLLKATEPQRRNWGLVGEGTGIHWPDVDEDLRVAGLLRGTRAPDLSQRAG